VDPQAHHQARGAQAGWVQAQEVQPPQACPQVGRLRVMRFELVSFDTTSHRRLQPPE